MMKSTNESLLIDNVEMELLSKEYSFTLSLILSPLPLTRLLNECREYLSYLRDEKWMFCSSFFLMVLLRTTVTI